MNSVAEQTILVADDDEHILELVSLYLRRAGYGVITAKDGDEALARERDHRPDLLILDVMMPGPDGLQVARQLRQKGDVPIVLLTARGSDIDKIAGLRLGADDYVTKPFDLRELKARVRAVLRRAGDAPAEPSEGAAPVAAGKRICFGKVCLDLDRRILIDEDGTEIRLTATEFDLLAVFARNPNRVLSRDRLLDTAPGRDGNPFDRSIDIRVTRIRKKVEIDPAKPQVIRTVRSVGYIYVPPRAAA